MIAIPAVGADIEFTWGNFDDQWLLKLPDAIEDTVLLHYDHLKEAERDALKKDPNSAESRELYRHLQTFRVEDWAKRFLDSLESQQRLFPTSVSPVALSDVSFRELLRLTTLIAQDHLHLS